MKKILVVILTLASSTALASTECKTENWIEASQVQLSNNMRSMLFDELTRSILKQKTNTERQKINDRIASIEKLSTLPEKCYKNGSIVELKLLNKPIST